jgi:hypothetical protein
MTSFTASPLLIALMQTATTLPVFLVGFPAGALADHQGSSPPTITPLNGEHPNWHGATNSTG